MGRLDFDLTQLAAVAARRRDDDLAFGYYLDLLQERGEQSDADLDALVAAITADVAAQIDCTACGNCCRALPVGLVPGDLTRLAHGLGLAPDEAVRRFADQGPGARAVGEWAIMRGLPCPLLAGRRCSIYSHRPDACRAYPALTPDFRWLYADLVDGASLCPIIFHVIDRLKQRLGW